MNLFEETITENIPLVNNNILKSKGRIGRKWYCINAIVLDVCFRAITSISLIAGKDINPFFYTLLPVSAIIIVFKIFNYKKRFTDISGNPKYSLLLSIAYLFIGFITSIYTKLFSLKVDTEVMSIAGISTADLNILIPDFVGSEFAQGINWLLLGLGLCFLMALVFLESKQDYAKWKQEEENKIEMGNR